MSRLEFFANLSKITEYSSNATTTKGFETIDRNVFHRNKKELLVSEIQYRNFTKIHTNPESIKLHLRQEIEKCFKVFDIYVTYHESFKKVLILTSAIFH